MYSEGKVIIRNLIFASLEEVFGILLKKGHAIIAAKSRIKNKLILNVLVVLNKLVKSFGLLKFPKGILRREVRNFRFKRIGAKEDAESFFNRF